MLLAPRRVIAIDTALDKDARGTALGKEARKLDVAIDGQYTAALGEVLYTRYFYFFQASGMILLTAMIGAIVLTLHHKPGVKRQDVGAQVARNPETAVEVRKVPSRAGI